MLMTVKAVIASNHIHLGGVKAVFSETVSVVDFVDASDSTFTVSSSASVRCLYVPAWVPLLTFASAIVSDLGEALAPWFVESGA